MLKASTPAANLLMQVTVNCVLCSVNLKCLKCDSNLITNNIKQGLQQRGFCRSLLRPAKLTLKDNIQVVYMHMRLTVNVFK